MVQLGSDKYVTSDGPGWVPLLGDGVGWTGQAGVIHLTAHWTWTEPLQVHGAPGLQFVDQHFAHHSAFTSME